MSNYIVKDTELTSVANAIRTKGGTNSQLVFPNGFVSAIGNISGGGGSSDFSMAEVTVNGTGAFFAEVASLKEGALYGTCFKPPLENSFTVVLYKGSTIMEEVDGTPAFTIPEGETNIVPDQDAGTYTITGNCTITLTPEH